MPEATQLRPSDSSDAARRQNQVKSDGLYVRLRHEQPIALDANLRCAPGELLALVGPSGSGKTTILHAIAGLFRPDHGEIRCNGEAWLNTNKALYLSPQRRRVGMVFQNYALFPHLSSLENVSAALGHVSRAQRAERARELLDLVHLGGLEKRHPGELSGGQKQRVALARALAREPAALLLDEPFSAVDQVTRRKLQRELVLLRRRIDIPSVLVTHDLTEATALADRMCALSRGRTLQSGSPVDVMMHPSSVLVAELMDLANIFEGIVLAHRAADKVTVIRWLNYELEATHTEAYPVGSKVAWVIPPSHVILHRRRLPSRGDRENPVRGTVGELVRLGEQTTVQLLVNGIETYPLSFGISTHAAVRNGLAVGEELTVSLLTEGIHLMPAERRDS